MPRKNRRKSSQQQFSERVNQGFAEAAGVTTGGHEMPDSHKAMNSWMRQQSRRGTVDVPLRDAPEEE